MYKCKKSGRKEVLRIRNGKYHGRYSAWSSGGAKLEEFKYYEDEFDGEMKAWDTTGFLLSHRFYERGIPIGFHKDFFSEGRPRAFIHYNDFGEKHGLSEEWREDGTRKDSTVYDNGDIIEFREYYKNGKLLTHRTQKPVNKDISGVYYDPNGKKTGEINNGNGVVVIYSEDGKSARRFYFENDEVVKHEEVDVQ
jgi:antitoxin component YwqK of YwqJK toxin-antitoxin module